MAIHQIIPALLSGDAMGNQAVRIRELLQAWGYQASIFADYCHPNRGSLCQDYRLYPRSPENLLVYHYGVGSDLTQFVRQLPDRVVLYYHNITPAHFLHGINGELENLLRRGREDLSLFKGSPLTIAASEYNRQELLAMGFSHVAVAPYILEYKSLEASAQSEPGLTIKKRFGDGAVNILFVGRIVPNKRQEDLIKVFDYYHRLVNPDSRLLLVGSTSGTEAYRLRLEFLVETLGLADSVFFCGHVGLGEGLGAYYEVASAFVSMSEHEGFCIPLLEAAHFGVPIIAYDAAGVSYTLADAGIILKQKRYGAIAELIGILAEDSSLRTKIVQGQGRLLDRFSSDKCVALLREAIDEARSVSLPAVRWTIAACPERKGPAQEGSDAHPAH